MSPETAGQLAQPAPLASTVQIHVILTITLRDRALRDARPDDRVVMEDFILRLTS